MTNRLSAIRTRTNKVEQYASKIQSLEKGKTEDVVSKPLELLKAQFLLFHYKTQIRFNVAVLNAKLRRVGGDELSKLIAKHKQADQGRAKLVDFEFQGMAQIGELRLLLEGTSVQTAVDGVLWSARSPNVKGSTALSIGSKEEQAYLGQLVELAREFAKDIKGMVEGLINTAAETKDTDFKQIAELLLKMREDLLQRLKDHAFLPEAIKDQLNAAAEAYGGSQINDYVAGFDRELKSLARQGRELNKKLVITTNEVKDSERELNRLVMKGDAKGRLPENIEALKSDQRKKEDELGKLKALFDAAKAKQEMGRALSEAIAKAIE